MCVILVVDSKRPSTTLVEKAWARNDHGGGVAWREGDFVRWEKGLNLDQMREHAKNLPLPYILHFRIASTGGRNDLLCHPFEVCRSANYKLKGKTKSAVLFHNGTWTGWRHNLLDSVIKSRAGKLPSGPWNDTRGLAFMAHMFGPGALEMINEKTIYFSPTELQVYGDGWEEESDILMSNTIFLKNFSSNGQTQVQSGGTRGVGSGNVQSPRLITDGTTKKETIHVITKGERIAGGSSHDIPFRGSIKVVSGGKDQQKSLEEDPQQLHEEDGTGRPKLSEREQLVVRQWATSQNPKAYSSHTPVENSHEILKRINLSQKGIEYLGRM